MKLIGLKTYNKFNYLPIPTTVLSIPLFCIAAVCPSTFCSPWICSLVLVRSNGYVTEKNINTDEYKKLPCKIHLISELLLLLL